MSIRIICSLLLVAGIQPAFALGLSDAGMPDFGSIAVTESVKTEVPAAVQITEEKPLIPAPAKKARAAKAYDIETVTGYGEEARINIKLDFSLNCITGSGETAGVDLRMDSSLGTIRGYYEDGSVDLRLDPSLDQITGYGEKGSVKFHFDSSQGTITGYGGEGSVKLQVSEDMIIGYGEHGSVKLYLNKADGTITGYAGNGSVKLQLSDDAITGFGEKGSVKIQLSKPVKFEEFALNLAIGGGVVRAVVFANVSEMLGKPYSMASYFFSDAKRK